MSFEISVLWLYFFRGIMFEKRPKIEFENEKITERKTSGFFRQDFFRSYLVQWIFIGTIFVALSNWVILIFYIRPIDLPIVLHYNAFLGVDVVGEWWQVYFLPIISNFFLIVNVILAFIFYQKKERLAAYIFLLASFFVQVGIAIALSSLIMINY